MPGFSRYITEITEFALKTKAKAAYCFVIDGDRGTGGSPLVMGLVAGDEYKQRCVEMIRLMRRSADLLAKDLERQGFGDVADKNENG